MINVNNKTVNWVLNNLAQGKQLYNNFNNLVGKMASSMIAIPVGNPATMSLSFMKNFINLQGITIPGNGGDISNVADSLMETAGKGNEKLDLIIKVSKFELAKTFLSSLND
jgi:hypothetical protein